MYLSTAQRIVAAGSLLYAAVLFLLLFLPESSELLQQNCSTLCQIIGALFGAACLGVYVWRGHHRDQTQRSGWLLLGLSTAIWGIGQAILLWAKTQVKLPVPSVGIADLFLSTHSFLLIAGVLLLFGKIPHAGRVRLLLDSAIAAISVGMLSWYYFVGELWKQSLVPVFSKWIIVIYPLGDVATLFGVIALLSGTTMSHAQRHSYWLLATGILLIAFTDTFCSYHTLLGDYLPGIWYANGWGIGFLFFGYAALRMIWQPKAAGDVDDLLEDIAPPNSPLGDVVRIITPYLAAVWAFCLVAARDLQYGHSIKQSTMASGISLMLLVIVRQIVTLLENGHLAVQMRAFYDTLELRVSQRTEQLSALLQLTTSVNTSLDIEQVLNAAAKHTQQALRADAIIVWLLEPEGDREVLRPVLQDGWETRPKILRFLNSLSWQQETETIPLPTSLEGDARQGNGMQISICLRAPLRWRQRMIGMIGVARWNQNFERTEVTLLESIGIEVGTAMENARLYQIARDAADRDPVTGLFNHRAAQQRLRVFVEKARAQKSHLSLMMVDLNNFKLFNDTYGHPIGDQVLKNVARALEQETSKDVILARYGGDEFFVLLPSTTADAAVEIARRVQTRLRQEGFVRPGDERVIPIELAFGVASFPEDSEDRHELLTIADSNLYAAKQSSDGIITMSDSQRANQKLHAEGSFDALAAMVTAVDNKDRYTRHHSEDVTEYALWIGEELGVSEQTMRVIRMSGLLHDVGKIAVPDDILRKPGRLTPEEQEVLKRHPRLGALIVGALPGMEQILEGVCYHHERWDGQGYPEALAGEAIPFMGRLLAVADAFSAMTTTRPYRQGLDWEIALQEIRANIGKQFDPEMAQAFLNAAQKRRPRRLIPGAQPIPALPPRPVPMRKQAEPPSIPLPSIPLMSSVPTGARIEFAGAPAEIIPAVRRTKTRSQPSVSQRRYKRQTSSTDAPYRSPK